MDDDADDDDGSDRGGGTIVVHVRNTSRRGSLRPFMSDNRATGRDGRVPRPSSGPVTHLEGSGPPTIHYLDVTRSYRGGVGFRTTVDGPHGEGPEDPILTTDVEGIEDDLTRRYSLV